jgi:hypothetical protein
MPPSTAALEAHQVGDAERRAEHETGGAGERTADHEGARDRLVDVDTHQRGGGRVLGDGPNPPAQLGLVHQAVEEHHHDHGGGHDDHLNQ